MDCFRVANWKKMQVIAHRAEGWSAMPASFLASLVKFSALALAKVFKDLAVQRGTNE
jgi:hypothetical protein